MNFLLIVTILALVALTVYTVRLSRKVDAIDEDVDELDDNITSTFGAVGDYIGALIVRVDRVETQLGGAANSKAQASGADVFAILNEAQAWAAANEPVPVVPGFVGFPQDYDPTYHFGGQQLLPKLGDTDKTASSIPVDYSRDR